MDFIINNITTFAAVSLAVSVTELIVLGVVAHQTNKSWKKRYTTIENQ